MSTSVDSLPPEIRAALAAAFPDRIVEDLAPLGGGLSRAPIFTCTVDGAAYVVRKNANPDPARRARAVACMRIASDLGVTPTVRHADESTGVTVVDRVDAAQMGPSTRGDPAVLGKVAAAVRRLHGGPAFPAGQTATDVLRRLDEDHRALAGEGLPAWLMDTARDLAGRSLHDAQTACHYDLNPNNILVTRDRVYLVDWDTAQQGDPYLDIAQLGVFAFPAPAQRDALLEQYLGRAPRDDERARLLVARVRALGIYAAAFFLVYAQVHRSPARIESAMPQGDLFAALAGAREKTDPGVIGASLLAEARRERESEAFARSLQRTGA